MDRFATITAILIVSVVFLAFAIVFTVLLWFLAVFLLGAIAGGGTSFFKKVWGYVGKGLSTPVQQKGGKKHCTKCGRPAGTGAFCANCGTKLKKAGTGK